jgi:hypothetical protein
MMKARLKYRPDLRDCELEDRLVPVIPNFGMISLTTDGYVLISVFPGIPVDPAGLIGATAIPEMGAGVLVSYGGDLISTFSGFATDPTSSLGGPGLTSLGTTISEGISEIQAGSGTGIPGLAAMTLTGSKGGANGPIVVGSGANDATAPIIDLVTRNTIANDARNAAPLIGRVSGDRSDVLPLEQVYRGGLPVSASGGLTTEGAGQRAGQDPDQGPVPPLPIRLRNRPHHPASDASGHAVGSHADRAP